MSHRRRRGSIHRRTTRATCLAALLLTASCSPPRDGVQVTEKQLDVAYGNQRRPSVVQRPPEAVQSGAPTGDVVTFVPPNAIVNVPPRVPGQPTVSPSASIAPRPPCPAAPPEAAFTKGATNDPHGVPFPNTVPGYPFRQQGTAIASGIATPLPTALTRSIRLLRIGVDEQGDAPAGPDTFRYYYEVTQTAPGHPKTITTYWPRTDEALGGLYLVSVVTEYADGSRDTFAPNPPDGVRLMVLPANVGASPLLGEIGTDPLSGRSIEIEKSVVQERPSLRNGGLRADACGKLVDTWNVQIIAKLRTPVSDERHPYPLIRIDQELGVSTQYGGLITVEVVRETALDITDPTEQRIATGPGAYSLSRTTTINVVPAEPCDPAKLPWGEPEDSERCEPPA